MFIGGPPITQRTHAFSVHATLLIMDFELTGKGRRLEPPLDADRREPPKWHAVFSEAQQVKRARHIVQ